MGMNTMEAYEYFCDKTGTKPKLGAFAEAIGGVPYTAPDEVNYSWLHTLIKCTKDEISVTSDFVILRRRAVVWATLLGQETRAKKLEQQTPPR